MPAELLQIFPIPVVINQYPQDFSQELEFVENQIEYEPNGSGNLKSKDSYLLKRPELSKIKDFITQGIHVFNTQALKGKSKLTITQSWSNKNEPGTRHDAHIHPNSIISGVFYFRIEENKAPLVFHHPAPEMLKQDISEYDDKNAESYILPFKSGELVLFPSSLRHSVPVNKGEVTRISLSFNTFATDYLGSEKLLTEMRIGDLNV